MPGPIDVSNDFDVFDDIEVVTYRKLNSDGATFTNIAPVNALGTAEHHRTTSTESLEADTIAKRWHLKAIDLNGVTVERGDRILDGANVEWVVESGDLEVWKTSWRCETLRDAS